MSEALEAKVATAPEAVERNLVAALRPVALRVLERPEVKAALAAAESIPPGLVIADETAAVTLADAVRLVIEGEKAIVDDLRKILRIPKAMEAAVREAVAADWSALTDAKARGNDARVAWQAELRRRAAAELARQQEEVRKATEDAEAAALFTGEEVPPPAEVAPAPVPRTIAGGAGKSGTAVRVEAKEIVDDAACPWEWKVLVRAIAEGFFRAEEQAGRVKRAAPGESVVWKGVRFESVERAVNRA